MSVAISLLENLQSLYATGECEGAASERDQDGVLEKARVASQL
jgi:hypothetical protein